MYAIVEIAGQQFKVEEGRKIFVHRLEVEKEKNLRFDKVLLIEEEDGKITIGEPVIKDAFVEGKILDHVRGDKVIVFKKKKKKGYRVKNGHRQNLTHIEIVSINGKSSPRKLTTKKEAQPAAEEPVKAEKKAEAKKPAKKAEAEVKHEEKKAKEKKPAAKKAEPKKKEK